MNYIFSIAGSLALPGFSFLLSNYAAYTDSLTTLGVYGVFIAKSALVSLIIGGWISHFVQNHWDVYSPDDISKLIHWIIFTLCLAGVVLLYYDIVSLSFGVIICCLNIYLAFIKRQQLWFGFACLASFIAFIQVAIYFLIGGDWLKLFLGCISAGILIYAAVKISILSRRSVRLPRAKLWVQVLGKYYVLGLSSVGSWGLSQGGRVVLAGTLSFEAAGQLTLLSAYGGVVTTIATAIWGPKHMSLLANSPPGIEKVVNWNALVKSILAITKILVISSLVVGFIIPQVYSEISILAIALVCIWYSLATIVGVLSAGFIGNNGRVFFCWAQFFAGVCALFFGWLLTSLSAQIESWLVVNCIIFLLLAGVVMFRFSENSTNGNHRR